MVEKLNPDICSVDDVTSFLGLDEKKAALHAQNIGNLITSKSQYLEDICNRWFTVKTITDKVFNLHELEITKDTILLPFQYRDIITVTKFSENDKDLAINTDIYCDPAVGAIRAINYWFWPDAFRSSQYKISGTFGYVSNDGSTKDTVKEVVVALVAVASGLWYRNYTDEMGNKGTAQVTSVPRTIQDQIARLRNGPY